MELEHRVVKLEERQEKTEEKVVSIDKSLAVYSAVFERNLQMQEKLAGSIDKLSESTSALQTTLTIVQGELLRSSQQQESNMLRIRGLEEETGREIEFLKGEIRSKLDALKIEVSEVDEKGKFDIVKFFKDNFVSGLLSIYILFNLIKEYLIPPK